MHQMALLWRMKKIMMIRRSFMTSQCRQFNDIKIERIFDQIQNSPFFSFCAKKAQKDTYHF